MKIKVAMILAAAVALLAPAAYAQVPLAAAASVVAGTQSSAGVINIVGAGGGGANQAIVSNAGTLANPQWVMGQSTVGPGMTSYDACTRARSGSILSIGAGWTQSDEDCVKQRQAEWLRASGQPQAAVERMCDIEGVRDALARASGYQCAATVAARVKAQPAQPVAVQPVAAPIVTASSLAPGCRVVMPGNYVSCQ